MASPTDWSHEHLSRVGLRSNMIDAGVQVDVEPDDCIAHYFCELLQGWHLITQDTLAMHFTHLRADIHHWLNWGTTLKLC